MNILIFYLLSLQMFPWDVMTKMVMRLYFGYCEWNEIRNMESAIVVLNLELG